MTEQIDIEELEGARNIFEAYCIAVDGISVNGQKIPEWGIIPAHVRYGWVCAYRAASERLSNAKQQRHERDT